MQQGGWAVAATAEGEAKCSCFACLHHDTPPLPLPRARYALADLALQKEAELLEQVWCIWGGQGLGGAKEVRCACGRVSCLLITPTPLCHSLSPPTQDDQLLRHFADNDFIRVSGKVIRAT